MRYEKEMTIAELMFIFLTPAVGRVVLSVLSERQHCQLLNIGSKDILIFKFF